MTAGITLVDLPLTHDGAAPATLSVGPEAVSDPCELMAGDWPAPAAGDGAETPGTGVLAEVARRIGLLDAGRVRIVPVRPLAREADRSSRADVAWIDPARPHEAVDALLALARARRDAADPDAARLYGRLAELAAGDLAGPLAADDGLRRAVFDRLAVDEAAWAVPWDALRAEASVLGILYNFQPFADTGSTVATKRLRVLGRTADVISCSFLHHKKIDPTVAAISRPYVARQRYLEMRPSWASWHAFAEFAAEARDQAAAWRADGARYDTLYTRANWAPSHYAGALVKEEDPTLHWIAEFSDPLSLDVQGKRRGDPLDRSDLLLRRLVAPVEERYGPIPDNHFSIFGLAEILPYAMADTVQFTNELQMAAMLEHVYSPELAERVRERADVSHHPSLPPAYYTARPVSYEVDPDMVNLAYFGEFYVTRGITDVTLAMSMLPPEIRDRIRLHVFTNFVPEGGLATRPPGFSRAQFDALVKRAQDGVGAHGIEHLVRFNASLPYLEFLAVTAGFDYLIVNDAHSGPLHDVNPFLPSKWSDYRGSSARTWALVEDGSVLSTMPTAVSTPVGDPAAARAVLWDLVERKTGDRNA